MVIEKRDFPLRGVQIKKKHFGFVISVPGGNKNILLDMMTHEIKHVSNVTKHFFGA